MKKTKLIWHIYLPFLGIIAIVLLATLWFTSNVFSSLYYKQLTDALSAQARLVDVQLQPFLSGSDFVNVDRLCKQFGQAAGLRITVILPDGQVIGDSDELPAEMKDHSDRPEFKTAIDSGFGISMRFSRTLGQNMMYVAVVSKVQDRPLAVIRVSTSAAGIENVLAALHRKIVYAGIAIAFCAALASWIVSRRISQPIEQMTETAYNFASGDFSRRSPVPNTIELAELAKALNNMAEKISGKIETITKDKDDTQAVLISMNRLEKIRQDFVANVSHELKTPITSIKGFVETLLEGAINDPQRAQDFLGIIARHANRLDAIINDLLVLCRLDEDGQKRNLSFETQEIRPVILSAVEMAKYKADAKNMTIEINCDDKLKAKMNAALLEQAVLNLIDNAVKYSQDGGKIEITSSRNQAEILIRVSDNGCGIENQHLDRIFERFYVVDKARSRKLGGTGLGLAIVKHIAQVHAGNISVESTIGKGSTFTIHLPQN